MNTQEEMQYIIRLRDEASSHMETIRRGFQGLQTFAEQTAKGVSSLQSKLTDFATWLRGGFLAKIGSDIASALSQALSGLIDMIPNAINLGRDYAQSLHDIQLMTGMTAEQTSIYAGILGRLGIPLDQQGRALATFGRNILENEDLLKRLGIATRDGNGAFLDTATIIANAQQQFNKYGQSLTATAAAQELLGRTGPQFLEFLQLAPEQVKEITEDLRRFGLVLGQDVLDGAERSNEALRRMQSVWTGVQTTIFAALEPTLTSFVNSFANFIHDNLQQIVTFAVSATNFVLGLLGGLLGFNFAPIVAQATERVMMSKKEFADFYGFTKDAADGATSAVNRQVKAIDAEIARIRARAQARQDANRAEQLALELAKAQAQLEDLRANSPFVAGLNNAERQLALQKHAADIADAQKAVTDARSGLADFGLDKREQAEIAALERQKARLQDVTKATKTRFDLEAAYAAYVRDFDKQADESKTLTASLSFDQINAAGKEWRDKGVALAADLKKAFGGVMDVLFGPEQWHEVGKTGQAVASRSGGLIGGISGLIDLLGDLAGAAYDTWVELGPLRDVLSSLADWILPPIRTQFDGIGDSIRDVSDTLGDLYDALLKLFRFLVPAIGLITNDPSDRPRTSSGSGSASGSGSGGLVSGVLPRLPTTTTPVTLSGAGGAWYGGHVPVFASGGAVRHRPGGTLAILGEAGQDEAVFNEDQLAMLGRAGIGAGGDDRPMVMEILNIIQLEGRELMRFVNRQLYYQANRQPGPLTVG